MTTTPQDSLDDLYRAVGFVTVWWAFVEQCLDTTVAVIFHQCGGKTFAASIPVSLDNKNEFLRECFKQLPALSEHKDEGLALLHDVMNFKEFRHNLTHGAVAATGDGAGKYILHRIKYSPELHKLHRVRFNLRDFPKKSKQLQGLAKRAARLSLELIRTHVQPEPEQQPPDEAGSGE